MEIAVVAGEASGDRLASELVNALRTDQDLLASLKSGEQLKFWGIGGVAMQRAGVRLVRDSREWGAIGIVEALRKAPGIYPAKLAILRELRFNRPDAVILVDFGAFNVPLGEWIKEHIGCPVYYYMPPGSWRRRQNPARPARLGRMSDVIVTPFPWSERILRENGANAFFTGHPLLDLVAPSVEPAEFDKQVGLDPRHTVITLLPGSRRHEVQHILPAMFGAAGEIAARVPGAQFLVALAPNLSRNLVTDILKREQDRGGNAGLLQLMHEASGRIRRAASAAISLPPVTSGPVLATTEGLLVDAKEVEDGKAGRLMRVRVAQPANAPVALVEGMTYDTIARADLVIAASGTATLEAAVLNRPMIIVYRGSKLMEVEWAIRKKALDIKFVGLPNILADRMVCPELIQNDASAGSISEVAVEMLLEPNRLLQMKTELSRVVKEQLGEVGAIKRAAALFTKHLVNARSGATAGQ